ncbi:hypothetical protein N7527_005371 [Penicillium freii]|nr:hypothetical protein N7527_005371 [Penicillium freii]
MENGLQILIATGTFTLTIGRSERSGFRTPFGYATEPSRRFKKLPAREIWLVGVKLPDLEAVLLDLDGDRFQTL